ncbi:potassium/sodium hyperpolarization-activated cyclic nucleotide-gated channel 4 [Hyalella azteca]|uniref:Potassium/sodium hyperpolarization-activated cyclic nucleotide-gated channel 4 n=1 Tax=Hyalella azteca TaxID=294128 RepID=A0A8B7PK93_HYAAZ|nr:potassium/sodium hyperpolarization-activated cyclic nucleotide-gated channel 4 [Hyalella azteca]
MTLTQLQQKAVEATTTQQLAVLGRNDRESEQQTDASPRPGDTSSRGACGGTSTGNNNLGGNNHRSSLGGNSLANSNGGGAAYGNGDGGASGMEGRRGSGRGSYSCVSLAGSNNGTAEYPRHQQQHQSQDNPQQQQQHARTSSGGGVSRVMVSRRAQRLPSLRLANGRVGASGAAGVSGSDEEEVRSPRSAAASQALREDIKISLDTTTCTDSLITALEDETAFMNEFISHEMNFKEPGKVHFGGDDISLYGTPKEEMGPSQAPSAPQTPSIEQTKPSFLKNQLQALFQPTDNKLAMKLFGSKKALMKERIRQKAAGHWIIHPCSNFR